MNKNSATPETINNLIKRSKVGMHDSEVLLYIYMRF